jgi:hypothetical protein
MRDLLIGLFYFLTTLGVAVFGVCLIYRPKRFYPLVSRPLLGRTSTAHVRDSDESDEQSGRKLGIIMMILGTFMFLMPLVIALKNPGNATNPGVPPDTHYSQPGRWGSYVFWFIFLCIGCSMAIKPLPILNYFRSKQSRLAVLTQTDLIGPRVVGVIVILIALFGLLQVARH